MEHAKDIAATVAKLVQQYRTPGEESTSDDVDKGWVDEVLLEAQEDDARRESGKKRSGIIDVLESAPDLKDQAALIPLPEDKTVREMWGVYARVSTGAQADNKTSIEDQVEEVVEAMLVNGAFPAFVAFDSFSGRATARAGLNSLFAAVRRHQLTGLGAWSIDRISRQFYQGAGLLQKAISMRAPFYVLAAGGSQRLHSTSQQHGDDWVFAAMQLLFADQYYHTLRRTTLRGRRSALQRGFVGQRIKSPKDPFLWTELAMKSDPDDHVDRPTTKKAKKDLQGRASERLRLRAGAGHRARACYRFLQEAQRRDVGTGQDTTQEMQRIEAALAKALDAGRPTELRDRLMRPYLTGHYSQFAFPNFGDIDEDLQVFSEAEYVGLGDIAVRLAEAQRKGPLGEGWIEEVADKFGLDRILAHDDALKRLALRCRFCDQPMTERARRRVGGRATMVFECKHCASEEAPTESPTTTWPSALDYGELESIPIAACPNCGQRHFDEEPSKPVKIGGGYPGYVEHRTCQSCGAQVWCTHHTNTRKRLEIMQAEGIGWDDAEPDDFKVYAPDIHVDQSSIV